MADASEFATVEAAIPVGYKQVTAPKNEITFAVPEGWTEIDSKALSNAEAIQEYLDQVAITTNISAEDLKAQMTQLDLTSTSVVPNADGFTENVNVNAEPVPSTVLPTAEQMKSMVSTVGGTAGEYKEIDTPLGNGAKQSYQLEIAGTSVQGVFLVVPSCGGSGFSVITVSNSSADSVSALADQVAGLWSKASQSLGASG